MNKTRTVFLKTPPSHADHCWRSGSSREQSLVINLEQHQHTLGLILNSSKDNLQGALPTLNTPINSKKGREYEVKGGGWGMRLK